jgi:hypothetical protein
LKWVTVTGLFKQAVKSFITMATALRFELKNKIRKIVFEAPRHLSITAFSITPLSIMTFTITALSITVK